MDKFFKVPFATSGDKTAVPDAADTNGNVSYTQGYGFDYQRQKTDPAAKNIERDKLNSVLNDITKAIAELQSQGVPDYITPTLNGGTSYSYSANALVRYSGQIYLSLADTNTAAPTDVTKWMLLLSASGNQGLFNKADSTTVAFTKTGAFTVSTSQALTVTVNGVVKAIASGTVVTMPTPTVGTDYAIWAKPDGTLEATASFVSPPVTNSRRIGGFHYAPGGNASAQAGGNTTPQINEYSFYDVKFRPACPDPRGMALIAGGYWMDIYLTGVDAITNGSSKYNVTMADGSSPPKVPTQFGGNGSTTYGSYTWFEAMELATAFGKRCPTQQEFMSAAYGTTEASSIGTDQNNTILNSVYTSKWGLIQATGVLWIWGLERAGPYAGASWNANTEGRGSEYNAPNAVILGGNWGDAANSGSRSSSWGSAASVSAGGIGSRFACDHLQLE